MPRTARNEVAGAIYHVWQRGNNRQTIFPDIASRRFFLALMRECAAKYGWNCLAYCLMGNHFHLVIETPAPTLGHGMRDLQSRYARWFNARYETGGGHAYKERFGARPVGDDEQFAQLLRYVARNPVRAGLCATPPDWPWSSHRALVRGRAHPLLDVARTLQLLESYGGAAKVRYARLFDDDGPIAHLDPDTSPWDRRPSLHEILTRDDLTAAIARARENGYRLAEIAEETGLSVSAVWRRSQRARREKKVSVPA